VLLFLSSDCLFNSFLFLYIVIKEMNKEKSVEKLPSKINKISTTPSYGFYNNSFL
jgi:hypothetical protein